MTGPIVLAADGSELSDRALVAGLAVLRQGTPLLLTTVLEPLDPTLVTGTGFAAGVMAPDDYDEEEREREAAATEELHGLRGTLGVPDAAVRVIRGEPGVALCQLAEDVGAAAIVIGSRGHGGLRRAVLGSVSDHVVRHAPCPVVVTSHPDDA